MRYGFIAFSFNRPLQLHALLTSAIKVGEISWPIWVLYHHADEYEKAYEQLLREMAQYKNITFVRRDNFRVHLLNTMENIPADRILCIADDEIFMQRCPMEIFDKYDLSQYIPSLRLGTHKDYCYYVNTPQRLPLFKELEDGLFEWPWNCGADCCDYNFPLIAGIFDRLEILALTQRVQFGNTPNQWEREVQPWRSDFQRRKGLCFKDERYVSVVHNRVQNVDMSRCMNRSPAELLKVWQEGKRIRYEDFTGKSFPSVMTEYEFNYVEREDIL